MIMPKRKTYIAIFNSLEIVHDFVETQAVAAVKSRNDYIHVHVQ